MGERQAALGTVHAWHGRAVELRSRMAATTILGIPVSLTDLDGAVATIVDWCRRRTPNFVCLRDVHGIMRAQRDPALMSLHEEAGLVTPDGMPLVWLARLRGHHQVGRTCGPDLMEELCRISPELCLRHYFYGGAPEVAGRLAQKLQQRFPGLQIVGSASPPFRTLTPEEDARMLADICAADPHIVWVGLGTPKQEFWMRQNSERLPRSVLLGVGAAFDFHAGVVARAPRWMQRCGLEWLHRLASEPRRLWHRYLVLAPQFAVLALREEWRRRGALSGADQMIASGKAAGGRGTDPAKRRVTALLACHNRKDCTLRALASLSGESASVFDLSVVLFDDGSRDGTAEAVRAGFSGVTILTGDGTAYWNGGMHRAWKHALDRPSDAYLWVNDDVALDPDALARLRASWLEMEEAGPDAAFVLVGATRNSQGGVSYGGMRRRRSAFALGFDRLGPVDRLTQVDTFNGNIVLVSAAAVERIGILDPVFFHMFGDIDYGLRANAAGVQVLLVPGTLGTCERNPRPALGGLSLRRRWRHMLGSPRGLHPASWWRMTRRHSGIWMPLHFLLPYRRLFYPAAWLDRHG